MMTNRDMILRSCKMDTDMSCREKVLSLEGAGGARGEGDMLFFKYLKSR